MHVCQQPSIAPVHTGSAAPLQSVSHAQPASQLDDVSQPHPVPQSVSHAQPASQLDDVLQAHAPPQSGSHAQDVSHPDELSQGHPPTCSQRVSVASHARPTSQPPPFVQAQPSDPIAHSCWASSPEHAANRTNVTATNARHSMGARYHGSIRLNPKNLCARESDLDEANRIHRSRSWLADPDRLRRAASISRQRVA